MSALALLTRTSIRRAAAPVVTVRIDGAADADPELGVAMARGAVVIEDALHALVPVRVTEAPLALIVLVALHTEGGGRVADPGVAGLVAGALHADVGLGVAETCGAIAVGDALDTELLVGVADPHLARGLRVTGRQGLHGLRRGAVRRASPYQGAQGGEEEVGDAGHGPSVG